MEALLMSAPHRRNGATSHNAPLQLTSEFASVSVELDTSANGPRLRIENQQNRRVVYLDPLELASLTWLDHDSLGPFLDPSQTGWSSHEGAPDDVDV
ncbi:MAG TPA: hypothetical protein VFL87_06125 [Thermoleophilaceae bacterium]|nr:hypothetical protein [Thermoleophilaceae bacterium]